jgi:hypothetical protein
MSDRHLGEPDRDTQRAAPRTLMGRIERFCTRINDGLAVFAAVLAVVVLVTAVIRVPDLLAQGLTAETEPGATPIGEWVD